MDPITRGFDPFAKNLETEEALIERCYTETTDVTPLYERNRIN